MSTTLRFASLFSIAVAAAACGSTPHETAPAPAPVPVATVPQAPPAPPAPDNAALIAEATQFVAGLDPELRRLEVAASQTEWANETDITPEHEAAAAKAAGEASTWLTHVLVTARKYDAVVDKLDPETRRKLLLLKLSGQPAPDDPQQAAELAKLAADMTSIYGKGKVCAVGKKKCKDLEEVSHVLQTSRKPAELLAAWKGWHDSVGRAERDPFTHYVTLANAGARAIGFADVGVQWRAGYDMTPEQFAAETDRLWNQVKPLYVQLHCYTRRVLNKEYGDAVVPKTGPIPAHLLGNMWAQTWDYLYPELEPYKGVAKIDVSSALVKQHYDAIKMVKMAESFYTSLGMDPLPDTFWQRSMFTKPPHKEVVCHASAWDVTYSNDLRIKVCIQPNQEDLITLHHELGHDYYYHAYYQLPILYQSGANDGFHEAIGDTIALSMTPAYLKQKGLLDKVVVSDQAQINALMKKALEKIAFLPFGLMVDRWRWDVFSGAVTPDQYNQHWWDLVKQYQGLVPPIERDATDFDPGAKYHVASNTPYMRYFLADILQFQFHRALCKVAGYTGPLAGCSIYGNKAAGAAFGKMLALGASEPWQDALASMTGERAMDASAILDYFAPLQAWLEKQNAGQSCGWD